MIRPLFVALIATGLASCSSYRKVDPIYGRQVIPSQRTGAVGSLDDRTPPPPRYYDSESGGPSSGGPSSGGPSSVPSPPSSGGDLAPPGGFDFQGGTNSGASNRNGGWGRPGETTPSRPASSSTSSTPPLGRTGPADFGRGGSGSDYGTSQYEKYQPDSGLVDPPPAPSTYPSGSSDTRPQTNSRGFDPLRRLRDDRPSQLASTGRSPRGSTPRRLAPDDTIDILDLPSGASSRSNVRQDRQVRPATFTEVTREPDPLPAVPQRSATFAGDTDEPYGYDPSYRWVKGRLEYSSMNRRWTLRYISLSDESDRYGGSVMLQDTTALKDLQDGDFVIVHGALQRNQDPSSFAPLYRVDRLSLVR